MYEYLRFNFFFYEHLQFENSHNVVINGRSREEGVNFKRLKLGALEAIIIYFYLNFCSVTKTVQDIFCLTCSPNLSV